MGEAYPAEMVAVGITRNAILKTWPPIFTGKNVNLITQTAIFMTQWHIVGAMVFAAESGTTHLRVEINKKATSIQLHALIHIKDVKTIKSGNDSSAATQSTIKIIKIKLTLLTTCLN